MLNAWPAGATDRDVTLNLGHQHDDTSGQGIATSTNDAKSIFVYCTLWYAAGFHAISDPRAATNDRHVEVLVLEPQEDLTRTAEFAKLSKHES